MMRRIAVGDSLESGGRILPYSGPVFTIGDAGHQVALIGGSAYCEACKNTGMVAKAGGPRRINFIGKTAADGGTVLCGCKTPPRIVATLFGELWCHDMAETMGVVASNKTPSGGVASVVVDQIDEQVRATGRVASGGYPYFIEASGGRIFSGRLHRDGHLPRVYTDTTDDCSGYWGR